MHSRRREPRLLLPDRDEVKDFTSFDRESVPRVAMQVTQGCLIVPVQFELYEASLEFLERDVLEFAHGKNVLKVLIDVSGIERIPIVVRGGGNDGVERAGPLAVAVHLEEGRKIVRRHRVVYRVMRNVMSHGPIWTVPGGVINTT